MRPEFTPEFIERFWSRVDQSGGPDSCWPFTGCRLKNGYGQIAFKGITLYTHRLSLELAMGEPLGDGWALHRCDNPPCCNPAHLYKGTNAENVADHVARGAPPKPRDPVSYRRGQGSHHLAQFSDQQVREIRERNANGETTVDLARDYGTSQFCIWSLVRRKSYRHVA